MKSVEFRIETEQEEDGRWIAEITSLPGAMTYGSTRAEAVSRVTGLALHVIADRIEHGEIEVAPEQVLFRAA